jgi:hypothetical protein
VRIATILLAATTVRGAVRVEDEQLRLKALEAIFSGTRIELTKQKFNRPSGIRAGDIRIDYPDGFAQEAVYAITAPPRSKLETCAAEDLGDPAKVQTTREVRLQLFAWREIYLAVIEYQFRGALPAMACSRLRSVFSLLPGQPWKIIGTFHLDPTHAGPIESIQFEDLDGDGAEEALVSYVTGGLGVSYSELLVLSIANRSLVPVTGHDLTFINDVETLELFERKLDLLATQTRKARSICFEETVYWEKSKRYRPPLKRSVCEPLKSVSSSEF